MCKNTVTVVEVIRKTTPKECVKEVTMVSLSDGTYGVSMKDYDNPVHFSEFQCECSNWGNAHKVFNLLVEAENNK